VGLDKGCSEKSLIPKNGARAIVQDSDFDFPIVIATMPATTAQRRTALGVVIVLFTVALAIAPFANVQVAQIDNFIPVLQTVLSVADLVTATLLLAQYSIEPQPALLVLASGYMFSGSFAFLQTLAFPGAYTPAGLIGDGTNTAAWFFVLWHTTFLGSVLLYALSKDRNRGSAPFRESTRIRIGVTIALALVAVAALSSVVTGAIRYLPQFYPDHVTVQTPLGNQVNVALCLLATLALLVLFVRRRSVLDLWLMVVLLAWIPNFLVAAIASSARFSLGWYAARAFALAASCMLLSVLLTEMTFLYSRLANALILQRRERGNRLMSVEVATAAMAHELRTPLGAIALNASAALSQLRAKPLRLEELDVILEDIEASSHRAGRVISSIRALSMKTPIDRKTTTSMEDVARQVLRLVEHDLQVNEVSVVTKFRDDLPPLHADTTQLQQVILNLVKNAIDAMSSVAPDGRSLHLATGLEGNSIVLLSVKDSGGGIPSEDQDRIFEPFFTTKAAGMGLGLAICRTIVEDHGGKLRLAKSDSRGSIFEFTLPVGG
jgi:signal transduction histidine kinase